MYRRKRVGLLLENIFSLSPSGARAFRKPQKIVILACATVNNFKRLLIDSKTLLNGFIVQLHFFAFALHLSHPQLQLVHLACCQRIFIP